VTQPTSDEGSTLGRFFRELSRRHVTRTAAIYAVAGLAVIEFADVVLPLFSVPVAVEQAVILLVLAGFPVSLMVAWVFEVGPSGVQRRAPARELRTWAASMVGLAVVAMALAGWGLAGRGDGPLPAASPTADPDPARPEIELLAPAEWATGGGRVFAAKPLRSIEVLGTARHSSGIQEVLANGRRLSATSDPDRHDQVRFSGFVEPPAPGTAGDVEVIAVARDGSSSARTFRVRTAPRPAAEPAQFRDVGAAGTRQRWAVIIGVSEYRDESIGDLQFADADARAVYEFLRSPQAGMGGIPESNIRLLVNEAATSRNIRSALTTFLRRSTSDDVIFVFVFGHGVPDPHRAGDLYILAHDSEMEDLAATAVPMRDVSRAMVEAYAHQKILLTDVVHSAGIAAGSGEMVGNAINEAILDEIDSSSGGFVAFTGSEVDQLSQGGEQFGGGHGVFTYFLLEGLRGAADDDGDGVVNLGEIMLNTRDRVRRATRNAQIPTISQTTFDRFWPMAEVMDAHGGRNDG
jgi:hypothetical protein